MRQMNKSLTHQHTNSYKLIDLVTSHTPIRDFTNILVKR